jgi:hypothetical protein
VRFWSIQKVEMDLKGRNVSSCRKLKVHQRKKTIMGSVSSVWFILFVWLNQAKRIKQSNQPNQVNQTNPVSPACLVSLFLGISNIQAIDGLLCQMCQNIFSIPC